MQTSIQTQNQGIPWVEKYRPTNFENIVLDPINRTIFKNILERDYFPNLLFYGPPGTGKTTTIINLINAYHKTHGQSGKGTVIHLNASDERGIDVIRNQIYQFVKSKTMFEQGMKFVILDEVDYMTKNAQQALKYLLQTSLLNVRFCLICNYISKIDESLKNEFIAIRFNQLPKHEIDSFLKHVSVSENLNLSDEAIDTVQQLFHSDIRSMVNFMQLGIDMGAKNIITNAVFEEIHESIKKCSEREFMTKIHEISIQYNMDKRNILKSYLNYIVRYKEFDANFLKFVAELVHTVDMNANELMRCLFHLSNN